MIEIALSSERIFDDLAVNSNWPAWTYLPGHL
jgi:hypothetical protein